MAEIFTAPGDWDVWGYVFWGGMFALAMLVAGYGIGLLWLRWRDGKKA